MVAVPSGRLYAVPYYVQVVGHPGTAGLRRLLVTASTRPQDALVHVLVAHAPYLAVGDHSFIYSHSPGPMSEPGRALRACEGTARRSGTYRADSFDIGVCLRTGWRRASVHLRPIDGGFACEFEPGEFNEQA